METAPVSDERKKILVVDMIAVDVNAVVTYHESNICNVDQSVITSNKGGGKCFCPYLFVCLSVSKITQKCVHGFG